MADRLSVITQRIGFALWQVQELEGVSARCFVLLVQARKGMGLPEGNALVEKAQARTFGLTIRQLTNAGLLSSEIGARFTALLGERNWLVHRSRADSRSAVHNDPALLVLVSRLNAIADEAVVLIKEISALAERFVRRHAISAQHIDQMAQQLLEEWHAADALIG